MSTRDEAHCDQKSQPAGLSAAAVAQVLDEQTSGWTTGQGRRVEEILEQHPSFHDQPESLLDLVHNEIYCRRRAGERPSLQEYLDRFPGISDTLKIQWNAENWFSDSDLECNAVMTTRCTPGGHEAASDVLMPESLGTYTILECLGQGGMGTVYKARHEHLGKSVAIKVLAARVTEKPDAVARFKREMKAVGALDHPNIVQAFDAGEINGIHYIAMELLSGTDLHRLVEQHGPLSVPEACSIIAQVAAALAAAHKVGLVHRDIKPSNIIESNGQVKLLDLGLARLIEQDNAAPHLTSVCQTFGTPDFMAPEQWDDPHGVDHHSDLYALGCTLFFLLAGRAPYGTTAYPTATRKMKAHLLEPVADITALRPDVPAEVAAICGRLMAKLPRHRFASADELQLALAPFVHEGAVIHFSRMETEVITPLAGAQRPPSTLQVGTGPGNPDSHVAPRRTVFGMAVSLLVIVMLSAGGAYVLDSLRQQGIALPAKPITKKQSPPASDTGQPGKASSTKTASLPEQTQEIWKLIKPGVVSDGRFQDVKVDGERVSLDASGASRQLWLDFQDFDGDQMTIRLKLRIRNPDSPGMFKLVMLPRGHWSDEFYFQVRRQDGRTFLNVSHHTKAGQTVLVEKPWNPHDRWHEIVVEFEKDQLVAWVDLGKTLEAPRKLLLTGTPAIAVSGWHVELDRPIVTIRTKDEPKPVK